MAMGTRRSSDDAEPKVYFSKRQPKQVHFPHKRKVVRRRATEEREGLDKRQMVFLPDKMKKKRRQEVRNSSDEEEEPETGSLEDPTLDMHENRSIRTDARRRTNRKRKSNTIEDEPKATGEPVQNKRKRRRKGGSPPASFDSETNEADMQLERDSKSTVKTEDLERRLRRQSTMTQLVEGRRPLPGTKDPEFKPVRRSHRTSWGGGKGSRTKDGKQRTLTQMIPGMQPVGILSSDDDEDDLEEELRQTEGQLNQDEPYRRTITERLTQQGLYQPIGDNDKSIDGLENTGKDLHPSIVVEDDDALPLVSQVEPSIEVESGEDDYQPTQYVEAPATRIRRSSRRQHSTATTSPLVRPPGSSRAIKSRFGLLSTPEKRRIREIPSSQSPAESPISNHVTPQKMLRSPLKQVSLNAHLVPETPSRRKNETCKDPPATLKFQNTIQDSEDEDEDIIEEDLPFSKHSDMPTMIRSLEFQDGDGFHMQSSNQRLRPVTEHGSPRPDDSIPTCSAPREEQVDYRQDIDAFETILPETTEEIHSTPPPLRAFNEDTYPSTPMVIKDESSDDEMEPFLTSQPRGPRPTPPTSSHIQQFADLDEEVDHAGRSAPQQHDTQESDTHKAELQLQSEWWSYSQYVNTHGPQTSSMNVTRDLSSYNATPLVPINTPGALTKTLNHGFSQATTVDEVTPKKKRMRRTISASSPSKAASSRMFISPRKPPPLFIPSSFPSPAKAGGDSWSSPSVKWTQDGPSGSQYTFSANDIVESVENFSIPPPPPGEYD
ncbi:hypothetical protein IQ07DRAFT_585603 [Pyrenochaeta sp. DS3sAY3a]|nr:hypothetical protein IQ07DRAFT_585603 [Pyrenochaeta sp. DS3sAY3a]